MNGNGYGRAELNGAVSPFTTEQRQRLEAVTFARLLLDGDRQDVELRSRHMVSLADYIVTGEQ